MEQLKAWVSGQDAAAAEEWDDALWPELCESYGADAADGLSWPAFVSLFCAQREAAVRARQVEAARALAEAQEVGAITVEERRRSSRRLRETADAELAELAELRATN
eukprot:COSAG04_NODE_255_length_18797_cov_46.325968_10_plen_107_part_00